MNMGVKGFFATESTSCFSNREENSVEDEKNVSNTGCFVNLIGHKIVSFEEAQPNIESNFPNWIVKDAYEIPSGYIFSVCPSDFKDDDCILGGFYKISKFDGSIEGYSPVMDPEEFKKALENKIL